MKRVKDLQPGTHFRRPDVNDGTRELVKLANPYNSGHSGCAHFSFDPETFELIGSWEGISRTVPVEAKRPETRNYISFTDTELRYIEAVMANVNHGPTWNLCHSIVGKIKTFLPGVCNRQPHEFMSNGYRYALGRGAMTTVRKDDE